MISYNDIVRVSVERKSCQSNGILLEKEVWSPSEKETRDSQTWDGVPHNKGKRCIGFPADWPP